MAKTIESKMEELKDAVRRQEEFTANFAHELKTPMTSIIGYADTLYQKTLSPEEVHQLAGIIMNEGMRLEALSFKLMELVTLRDYGRGIPKEDVELCKQVLWQMYENRRSVCNCLADQEKERQSQEVDDVHGKEEHCEHKK